MLRFLGVVTVGYLLQEMHGTITVHAARLKKNSVQAFPELSDLETAYPRQDGTSDEVTWDNNLSEVGRRYRPSTTSQSGGYYSHYTRVQTGKCCY